MNNTTPAMPSIFLSAKAAFLNLLPVILLVKVIVWISKHTFENDFAHYAAWGMCVFISACIIWEITQIMKFGFGWMNRDVGLPRRTTTLIFIVIFLVLLVVNIIAGLNK